MARLIDSSIIIALERRGQRLDALAAFVLEEPIALASITASELLVGAHRAGDTARRLRREAFVEAVLEVIPVISFDLQVARTHARLLAQLTMADQPNGAHDLLMAATAVAHGHSVLTDNLRDFDRVPGLQVSRPNW